MLHTFPIQKLFSLTAFSWDYFELSQVFSVFFFIFLPTVLSTFFWMDLIFPLGFLCFLFWVVFTVSLYFLKSYCSFVIFCFTLACTLFSFKGSACENKEGVLGWTEFKSGYKGIINCLPKLCVSSPVLLNVKIDLVLKINSLLTFRPEIRPR